MKNTIKIIGIISLTLVIGLAFFSCDSGSGGGTSKPTPTPTPTTDPALNGTWVGETTWSGTYGGVEFGDKTERLKISNGIIEFSFTDLGNDGKYTFTTEVIGTMKVTLTHVWGKRYSSSLEAKWYSKADLKAPAVLVFCNIHIL